MPSGRFFLPGPTEVHPDVLGAQNRPIIGHRGRAIQELMRELQAGLEVVFFTERPVFISTSSATGLMEAAVPLRPPLHFHHLPFLKASSDGKW